MFGGETKKYLSCHRLQNLYSTNPQCFRYFFAVSLTSKCIRSCSHLVRWFHWWSLAIINDVQPCSRQGSYGNLRGHVSPQEIWLENSSLKKAGFFLGWDFGRGEIPRVLSHSCFGRVAIWRLHSRCVKRSGGGGLGLRKHVFFRGAFEK